MARTTFTGPVLSKNGFEAPNFTVATAPDAINFEEGTIVYVADGAAGQPTLAFSDGVDWLRSDTNAPISAS